MSLPHCATCGEIPGLSTGLPAGLDIDEDGLVRPWVDWAEVTDDFTLACSCFDGPSISMEESITLTTYYQSAVGRLYEAMTQITVRP